MKALLSIVEKAKFRIPVRPGDCLEYHVIIDSINEFGGKVTASAQVSEQTAAESRLVFSFSRFQSERLEAHQAAIVEQLMRGIGPNEAI